jgi:hypothetical protein
MRSFFFVCLSVLAGLSFGSTSNAADIGSPVPILQRVESLERVQSDHEKRLQAIERGNTVRLLADGSVCSCSDGKCECASGTCPSSCPVQSLVPSLFNASASCGPNGCSLKSAAPIPAAAVVAGYGQNSASCTGSTRRHPVRAILGRIFHRR